MSYDECRHGNHWLSCKDCKAADDAEEALSQVASLRERVEALEQKLAALLEKP